MHRCLSNAVLGWRVLTRSPAARPGSAKMGYGWCSACTARGVTLWPVARRLVCANCRTANEMAYAGKPGIGKRRAAGKLLEKREL
jgi:hypothetical protein